MVPSYYQVPATIILLGGGLLVCFLGYRLFRMVLAIYGFAIGAFATRVFLGDADTWQAVVGICGGGVLGALILLVTYFIGIALIGAALGALVVHITWPLLVDQSHWLVVVAAAILGAFISLALRRYVGIVGTSVGGAWSALVGGLALAGDSTAMAVVGGDIWVIYPMSQTGQRGFAVAWLGLSALALFVQLRATARQRRKKG